MEALTYRGKAYEAVKSYKEAIGDFSRAIEVDPAAATPEMYYDLGKNYLLGGDWDRAVETLTKVVQMQAINGLAYANRGVAYKEKGEFLKAAEDFRKALSLLKEESRIATVRRFLNETEKRIQASRPPAPVAVSPDNSLSRNRSRPQKSDSGSTFYPTNTGR